MINITVIRKNQNIITIEATGHSGYAPEGSDIVCSAVSTLTQNLILGLQKVINLNPIYKIDQTIPHLSVTLEKELNAEDMAKAQILMQSAYLGLKDLRDSYSKFIKIKEKQL